jgi:hypothetical protein
MSPLNIAIIGARPDGKGDEWLEQYMKQEVAELVARKSGVPGDAVVITQGHDPSTEVSLRWSIHDVLSVRADLTDEEARDVLQEALRRHDASVGISWAVLEEHAHWIRPQERQVTGELITAGQIYRARLHMRSPAVVLFAQEAPATTPAGWFKVPYGFNGRRRVMLRVMDGGAIEPAQYHARRHLLVRIADGDA